MTVYDRQGNPVSAEDVLSPEELAEYNKQHPERRRLYEGMTPLIDLKEWNERGNRVQEERTGDPRTRAGGGARPLAEEEQQEPSFGQGTVDGDDQGDAGQGAG